MILTDPLALTMAALTAFVAATGVFGARSHWRLELAAGRADARIARRGHALYAALSAALLLALLANDLALAWAAVAVAVLVLVASLRLGDAAVAAWRLFLLGGAGLALALLGTLLLALAAEPVLGPAPLLRWSLLAEAAPQCHGPLLTLAYAFLVLGYGTLAGLVPLHGALAQPQAPLPGGLLPGVALVTLLRARALVAANSDALSPGPPLLALGLLSLLLAALALRRQRDPEKFLAVAAGGQAGVVAFAFGLGGGAAIFAGVLHLILLTLLRPVLAQGFGRAIQLKGGAALGGLVGPHRALGLTLAAGLVALAGVPPFGLFTSLFLIVMETSRQAPWLAVPLVAGLAGCAFAVAARLVSLCRDAPTPDVGPAPPPAAFLPAWLHLAVIAVLGLAMPAAAVDWLAKIAEALR